MSIAIEPRQFADDELVICVHGTYAAREADEGDSWWQRGSDVFRRLEKRLPAGIRSLPEGQLFHWSGENSERERIKAAVNLLDFLDQFESKGKRYQPTTLARLKELVSPLPLAPKAPIIRPGIPPGPLWITCRLRARWQPAGRSRWLWLPLTLWGCV